MKTFICSFSWYVYAKRFSPSATFVWHNKLKRYGVISWTSAIDYEDGEIEIID